MRYLHKPAEMIKLVLEKLKNRGKGIILMHDFQRTTADGLATLLDQLKLNGFKVVHMIPKKPIQTLPEYDETFSKDQKLRTVDTRPSLKVVHTVN